MAKLGVVAAARAAGVSRATMNRYIKAGKVAATKSRDGKQVVDTAELMRVFGELQPHEQAKKPFSIPSRRPSETGVDTSHEVASLRREISRLERDVERLERELAEEKNDRRHLQSLLNQRALPSGGGIIEGFARLFGR